MTSHVDQPVPADELRLENVLVGTVLFAAGALGVVLGLLRPTFTLEAGFGAAMVLLGLDTLWGAKRSNLARRA